MKTGAKPKWVPRAARDPLAAVAGCDILGPLFSLLVRSVVAWVERPESRRCGNDTLDKSIRRPVSLPQETKNPTSEATLDILAISNCRVALAGLVSHPGCSQAVQSLLPLCKNSSSHHVRFYYISDLDRKHFSRIPESYRKTERCQISFLILMAGNCRSASVNKPD